MNNQLKAPTQSNQLTQQTIAPAASAPKKKTKINFLPEEPAKYLDSDDELPIEKKLKGKIPAEKTIEKKKKNHSILSKTHEELFTKFTNSSKQYNKAKADTKKYKEEWKKEVERADRLNKNIPFQEKFFEKHPDHYKEKQSSKTRMDREWELLRRNTQDYRLSETEKKRNNYLESDAQKKKLGAKLKKYYKNLDSDIPNFQEALLEDDLMKKTKDEDDDE